MDDWRYTAEVNSSDAKDAVFEQFARVGKALSSAKRLELLDLLSQGERSVDSLSSAADLKLTTASAHLQVLKESRLVKTRRKGTKVFYRLAGDDVADLYVRLQGVAQAHLTDLAVARLSFLGPQDTEHVDRVELWRRVQAGEVTVIDVRPDEEYAGGHIPGALSVPLAQLEARLAELPADQEIVAYCRGEYCVMSHDAVRLLRARGRRAARLSDGMLEWRLADLPVAN